MTAGRSGRRSRVRALAGWVLALAGLAWVLHDVHPASLVAHFAHIAWGWAAAAIVLDVLSYSLQGLRWRLLLSPSPLSALRATQAVYAGLFTNEILPFRFGELVRAWLAARWTGRSLLSVLPSIAVERLFDGFWLVTAIGLAAIAAPVPRNLLVAADVLGGCVLVGAVVFALLILSRGGAAPSAAAPPPKGSIGRLLRLTRHLIEGVRAIGISRAFFASLAVSALVLTLQMVSFWLVMVAFGIHRSPLVGGIVFLIVHLGTALPNAPSNVGSYQFFCVIGLQVFGIDKTTAATFSFAVFALLTAPLWILGSVAVARSGTTIARIRADLRRKTPELVTSA